MNNITKYNDDEAGTAWDGPLAVVTNKFSASASEILAGAVQDYKRGIVIGDRTTHGKGTVQSLMDISEKLFGASLPNRKNYGALKITMQQFYRPNGDSTQRRGVEADVPLPSTTNEMDIGEADLDYAVKFDTVPIADHAIYNQVRPRNRQPIACELAAASCILRRLQQRTEADCTLQGAKGT